MGKAANDNCKMIGVGNIDGVAPRLLENLHEYLYSKMYYPAPHGFPRTRMKTAPLAMSGGSVYVISDEDASFTKIGVARNVLTRLASLQTGNPRKLFVYRSFDFDDYAVAKRVELWSHEIAGRKFSRVSGEWFKCSPSGAHIAVDEASKEVRVSYRVYTPILERETVITKQVAA